MAEILIKGILLILVLFLAAAYMTFCERLVIARVQMRLGPNRVGPFGLLQPLADGMKLLCKERFQPAGVDALIYWLAPAFSVFTALFAFVLIPVGGVIEWNERQIDLQIADLQGGVLFLLAFSSLGVYGVVLSGWASNSRYALMGGLRGTAQMISYEIPMSLSLVTVALGAGTLSLREIVEVQREGWLIWSQPISFLIYLVTGFAETNRAPFDLPEAEQELTAGYHTEYGGMKFAMFFLAEYINILVVSALAVTLFLGGWHGPGDIPVLWFALKVACFVFLFFLVRATMARLRYDQLMSFGWKVLIPVASVNLILTAGALLL